MSHDRRYVFDTNTLISALLFENSNPGQAFRRALGNGIILLSISTLEELAEVLKREKFDRYLTEAEREAFVHALVDRAMLIEPDEEIWECRDPQDNKFLELAVSGSAACIISGDRDLLILNPFRNIAIMTAREFLEAEAVEPESS
jgi:putative PIN family toxin of toxin-antitoxin system